jgi:NAD(P)-dependent dehydrogenase (short-subunit alcohol dehydrogenase family)
MANDDTTFAGEAEAAAEKQRAIQRGIDAKEANGGGGKGKSRTPPQTGQREYPVPPLPKQHQSKPGLESELDPAPMYEAPGYLGSSKLDGMAAIVTGGDSGIGRAVAVLFAREGADVAIVYLEEAADAEATRAAVENEGQRCLLIQGDVANPDFCRHAVARTVGEFGRLDILVNNAAFQEHVRKFEDLTEEHFDRTLKTNLYGYFHMAKAAVPHIGQRGSIINTGSITGIDGSKHLLDYAMTKGGIHAFTRSLAGLLLERGIRVNAVAPGPVWTPLNPADKDAERASQFGSDVPMKRPAQPEEIAPADVFLAAPACSSYITGEILPIIGGYG